MASEMLHRQQQIKNNYIVAKYIEKQLIFFILFSLLRTTIVIGQPINTRLGVRDSLQSLILKENRKFITHRPQGYDTSRNTYTVLYLLDGSEERLQFFSSMMKSYFKENLVIVAIQNTNRDRDMMPLSVPSYPVAKPGADNFLLFIRDELIPEIENKNRTNGQRILCGQSLSAVFTLFAFLTEPQLFDSYIGNSVGWYADMDYFFSPLVDKAFQNPDTYKGKRIFLANSENDSYDPRKEILKSMDGFSKKVQDKLGSRLMYKYETYSKYGHVPYPAFYDAMKFSLTDNKGK
jgi:predicted alpha/beta superfamily hydrolase